ncbi:ribosomal protein L7/L12 [Plasmodium yoelii 17X]|uniref:Ribosomal protein L12 n=4 Tax=Plasmodium yoelii TaxID=5861 RepID=A0AAE9WJW2_PLAYO|nr:ribosomal protein L12, mitochondrial, putative [Plasmodium yoelii]EAA15288.1 ribosomal protein L7/L12 [Plasmodium yoelii yoelii]ETB57141.1 ribosomal protein L7/L12 [Plasmodium yoelii 17X]WBY55015.1 ribosomal protein L12 [Plasmodium yoelii yoelii]CDU16283.1 mitochondrial ribosomal protein L12 precursor, putative [Plasmodium yoelii]VTZ72524.1 ribosomal protein L12, mitochondrial, putative [Plasmodium yoelii]|eukprot:XP_723723.1 ribosomal protein L12, mitochondrial, putative [Plasmodium yoelii]
MINKCRHSKLFFQISKIYNKRDNDTILSFRKIIPNNFYICFFQICRNRFYSTSKNSSSYDIFDKIKDSTSNNIPNDEIENESTKKRKPSKKVLKLADDILNLTLIEAADLCDICQEKLEGNTKFNNGHFINRNPFPHPSSFFGVSNMHQINGGINIPVSNITNTSTNVENANSDNTKQSIENEKTEEKKKPAKTTFNVKLEKFDVKNKINTIKEIRKITNVGLKEAKEMVESAPFYIQKNAPTEQADEIKKIFENLGATIILE